MSAAARFDSLLVPEALLRFVTGQFEANLDDIHGIGHWERVRKNGVELVARIPGADTVVVEYFSLLHDSRRWSNDRDPDHGRRAAEFVRSLPEELLPLDPARRLLLSSACEEHADGRTEGDPTLLACWDADRLDLGRAGIQVEASRLCTDAARELLKRRNREPS